MSDIKYQLGFGNHFATEALDGALPEGQNSPQKAPYGLIAELLSGTAFTAPRHENKRSWLYRIRPSVIQEDFQKTNHKSWLTAPNPEVQTIPNQLRWDPMPYPKDSLDFIQGIQTFLLAGDAKTKTGSAVHLYACNQDMTDKCFYNSDGEMLIVPQEGKLLIRSEFGLMELAPKEIAVLPRGVKFQVKLLDGKAKGYLLENYGRTLELPQLGPIGSNGLANPRDFKAPTASYLDEAGAFTLECKFNGQFFTSSLDHNPFDVVAWHGNYCPYKYNLEDFNTINTVSFDHPDPSIFTVLTSPTDQAGVANVDFVIFPPRWMVAEKTFRPPYFHRNTMSEYMGLIHGVYDAKPAGGFEPGGGSLHSCMSAHGPEADAYHAAIEAELKPSYQGNTLAFMFETSLIYELSPEALQSPTRQKNYINCWQNIKPGFDPKKR